MAPLLRQTRTLTAKTLTIFCQRRWLSTLVVALLGPVIYIFIIGFSKNFFVPPSEFGVGSPSPLRSFEDALAMAGGGRHTLPFVTNNITGLEDMIGNLSDTVRNAGLRPVILQTDDQLITTCRSSIRSVSNCFAALTFYATPASAGFWSYTIRTDGSLGANIYVNRDAGDADIYALPLQHAVDSIIAQDLGATLPVPDQYVYTSQTPEQRDRNINRLYMGTLIDILGLAYFVGLVGICYQGTGFIATERELQMTSLIDSMMPNRKRWQPQALRILANHLAFDILYLPSWIIIGAIVSGLNYTRSSSAIMIFFTILTGLSLSSWSSAFAALFRKAQLSGITCTIVSIVLAIIIQVQTPNSTTAIVIWCLIFPPINFTVFIIWMAYYQQQNIAADLLQPCPSASWRVPGYAFFIIALVQTIVYPFIAAALERFLHGTSSKARNFTTQTDSPDTVRIEGLSKTYGPGWLASKFAKLRKPKATVQAVNNLDLNIRRGELSVLLGANGSGKSTTMAMLAGLQRPTSGTIDINGSGLGLCPQQNVLYDELTCVEHVQLFNRLKAVTPDTKDQICDLLTACDLSHKLNAKAKTLSGGQQRKLQLAMMFTGGSDLCLVDEASSGLDPLSRRKVWDILLAERGRRSILYTSHYLDEADLLSDHITILSKGRLVAAGSSVQLKGEHGGGYRVKIYTRTPIKELEAWTTYETHTDHVVYNVGDSAAAMAFTAKLDEAGIHNYRVLGPSIEDVFLKLAAEADSPRDSSLPISASSSDHSLDKGLELASGRRLPFLLQAWVLFRKRWTVLRRNYLPHLCAVLVPVLTAGLVTLFVQNFEQISCSPAASVREAEVISLGYYLNQLKLPIGPPGQVSDQALVQLYPGLTDPVDDVSSLVEFNDYIRANYSRASPGGFFIDRVGNSLTGAVTGATFAYRGDYGLGFAVITQNLLDSSILGIPIQATYSAFDFPFAPGAGNTLQFILYFGLAMCVYPAFFSLYPTLERRNKVRALHYSNGVLVPPLWLAYALFDFIFVLMVSGVSVIIFASATNSLYYIGWLFPVFFLYGLAATMLAFCMSLVVKSQLGAFASAAGYLCGTFLLYFVTVLCILTYVDPSAIDRSIIIAHFTFSLISPSPNLLRAMLVTFNEFSLLCDGTSPRSYPGDILVFGGPILYSIIQAAVLLGVLVWVDSGWRPTLFQSRKARTPEVDEIDPEYDAEVRQEKARVETCQDSLRVNHISKTFGENTAVQDVSFGVPRGTITALLGPNGAGKTTVMGMIRGEIAPSGDGDVLIEDVSIVKRRAAARVNLGTCPQHDCIDRMTAIDHLRFYARARGIKDVEYNVDKVLDGVGLRPFKDRMAGKLSGGNKRKLSLGIALIGNPSVLLVDEGSSGLDVAAQRRMWATIHAISADRSLVITTHAMEEVDNLADTVLIMSKKMLVRGTTDSLRQKYSDSYLVHVVHADAPASSEEAMAEIKAWIKEEFPAADVEDRSFHGQIRFSVPSHTGSTASLPASSEESSLDVEKHADEQSASNSDSSPSRGRTGTHSIAALFASLEANKERLKMAYYTVSQSTLDTVFLEIIGRHNVLEEGHQLAEANKKIGAWTKFKRQAREMYHNA